MAEKWGNSVSRMSMDDPSTPKVFPAIRRNNELGKARFNSHPKNLVSRLSRYQRSEGKKVSELFHLALVITV